MELNKKSLSSCRLYLILDRDVATYDQLFEVARQAVKAGVDIIQLRDKQGSSKDILNFSKKLVKFLQPQVPVIVNDRVDIALLSGAAGVHLGQEDIPLLLARRLMGKKAIIGLSAQTFKAAQLAQLEGADYIGFGSVFKTKTKPDRQPMDLKLLKKAVSNIKIPLFAIGGINLNNVDSLRSLGVKQVAVCRAIIQSPHVSKFVKTLLQKLI